MIGSRSKYGISVLKYYGISVVLSMGVCKKRLLTGRRVAMPAVGKEAAERNETGGSSFGCCPWMPMTAIHDKSPIEGLCHVCSTISKNSRHYSAGGLYLRFKSRMAVPTSVLFASSRAMMSCMTPGRDRSSPASHCRTRRGSTFKRLRSVSVRLSKTGFAVLLSKVFWVMYNQQTAKRLAQP